MPCPTNADEAAELANAGHLAMPHSIVTRTTEGKQWPEIVQVHMQEPLSMDVNKPDEVPF